MKRMLTPLLMIAVLAAAVGLALAQTEAALTEQKPLQVTEEQKPLQLTEDEAVVFKRAQELQKELEIARLELALAQARDLPESEIAKRAEQMYRLQGSLYALHAKNPELARKVWEYRQEHRWRHREHMGRGHGPGMGRGRGHGPRGMGRGGGGEAWGMGPGMGRGRGHRGQRMGPGMGPDMGPGMGLGRGPGHGGMGRGPGHGGMGLGPGMGRGRGQDGPGGMGLGRDLEFGPDRRTTDAARLHLAPALLPPDIEIEIAPEPSE